MTLRATPTRRYGKIYRHRTERWPTVTSQSITTRCSVTCGCRVMLAGTSIWMIPLSVSRPQLQRARWPLMLS